MGAAAEDFTNTGGVEIAMTNGFDWGRDEADPEDPMTRYYETFKTDRTRVWMRSADGSGYVDAATMVGIDDPSIGHALVAFDMDRDGDLDLLIVPSGGPPILYRNDTPTDRSWLTIQLDDPTSPGNRWGDGARIVVHGPRGTEPTVDWISTSGSYESQKPPHVHVGFGDATDPVKLVEVFWPGQAEPQRVVNSATGQVLTIRREF